MTITDSPGPATPSSLRKIAWRHYAIITGFCLLVHGLLLLNDGIYWDGWLIYTFLKFGHFDRLYSWFSQSGALPIYYVHRFMGLLPGMVFCYKLAAFLLILASTLLIYRIGVRTAWVDRRESLLIALIALCYPAFQVSVELVVLPFLLTYAMFLAAVYLAVQNRLQVGKATPVYPIVACLLFFLSFFVGSLLVFYLGFLWLLAITPMPVEANAEEGEQLPAPLRRWPLRVPSYYLLLPIAFWVVKSVFFAPVGVYKHYNKFNWSPHSIGYSVNTFLAGAIYDQFMAAIALFTQPVAWLFCLLFLLWTYKQFGIGSRSLGQGRSSSRGLLIFGGVLLLLAILPYSLVAKPPSSFGYDTRNALLIGLPMAVIIVAVCRLFCSTSTKALSRTGWVVLAGLSMLCVLSTWNYYLAWQARGIKYHAVLQSLSRNREASRYSVYWVDDNFLTGGQELYSFQELSSMFRVAWGGESRIGIDLRSRYWLDALTVQRQLFMLPWSQQYNLTTCNPRGPQARLLIRRGPAAGSNLRIVGKYYYYKFVKRGNLSKYLSEIADVRVTHHKSASTAK